MKSLKKLTALLLAAVMALAMLTACGGGGGGGNSLSEKERNIKKINQYLHNLNSSYNELSYDRTVDGQAKSYQEVYESLVKDMSHKKADTYARDAAHIADGNYRVLQLDVDKSWSNNVKINFIGSKIYGELTDNGRTDDALLYGEWKIGYVWGANDSKKKTQPIYIVLKETGAKG